MVGEIEKSTATGTATTSSTYDHTGERATYTDTSATTRYINQFYTTETTGYVKSRYIYANGQLVVTIEDAPELGGIIFIT